MNPDVRVQIENWRRGVLMDGSQPFPTSGRRGGAADGVVDWERYRQMERLIGDWPAELKTVFLAEYAPFKADRDLRRRALRDVSRQERARLLRMALFDLELCLL